MKKLSLFLIVFMLFLTPVTVFASPTEPNAVNDILVNQRYEGAIESIHAVTEIVDTGFTAFITFVAFLIISAAMLRNVLAGAYCAYPKFFDKVAAAHEEVAETGWVTRVIGLKDNYQNINMGSLGKMLLRLIPNIKTLTDFEEENLEPKSYFIKAIPQMIGVIIIGVFIYNGYYRDTAAVVSNFGSEMFKRVIVSADPVAMFDRITGATGKPEFNSDVDLTDIGKLQNRIAENCYAKVISTYTDVKGAANKSALAAQLDSWVGTELHNCEKYAGNSDNWKYSYKVTMTVGKTSQEGVGTVRTTPDEQEAIYVFNPKSIASLNLDSTKEVGVDWHLNVSVSFKKRASGLSYKTLNDLQIKLKAKSQPSNGKVTIALPAGEHGSLYIGSTASATIDGHKAVIDGNNLIINYNGTITKQLLGCSGIYYKDSNGRMHKVAKIGFGYDSNVIHSSSTQKNYKYGEAIEVDENTEDAKPKKNK